MVKPLLFATLMAFPLAESPPDPCHDTEQSVCLPRDLRDKVAEKLDEQDQALRELDNVNRDLRLRLAKANLCS